MLSKTLVFVCAILLISLPHNARSIPIPGRQCMLTFCPNNFADFPPRYARIVDTIEYEFKTNAQRLRNGVFLKPPMRRTKPTAVDLDVRQAPSPVPPPPVPPITPPTTITHCGALAFMNSTRDYIGYADRAVLNSTGQITSNETFTSSLEVCFRSAQGDNIAANVSLTSSNWTLASDFPLVGLVQGFYNVDNSSEIAQNLPNYLTFGAIPGPEIPAGTLPADINNTVSYLTSINLTAATNVWSFDINTNIVTVQWTNPDGSLPTTYIFAGLNGVIYAGGDPQAFSQYYNQTVEPLTMHFIPAVREV